MILTMDGLRSLRKAGTLVLVPTPVVRDCKLFWPDPEKCATVRRTAGTNRFDLTEAVVHGVGPKYVTLLLAEGKTGGCVIKIGAQYALRILSVA